MMFGAMDSHFSGYAGHEGFIRRMQEEKRNIVMDFVIEHVAMEAVDDIEAAGDEMRFTGEIRHIYMAYPITWTISSVIYLIYYLFCDWVHGFDKKADN